MIKKISKEEFNEKLNSKEYTLIDVRSQEEHGEEKIAESEVCDITQPDFSEKIGKLDKDKKYLIYCRSGARSEHALQVMKQMGFKEVSSLEGGMMGI
jgi:rhodanese-related sulfurtransferase